PARHLAPASLCRLRELAGHDSSLLRLHRTPIDPVPHPHPPPAHLGRAPPVVGTPARYRTRRLKGGRPFLRASDPLSLHRKCEPRSVYGKMVETIFHLSR